MLAVFAPLLVAWAAPLAPTHSFAAARLSTVAMSEAPPMPTGEAADMVMAAETPEELLIDLLRTVERKNVEITQQLQQTEALTASVAEKDATIEEVIAELKAAQEEIEMAELVANQLANAREELASLNEQLQGVEAEKAAIEERSVREKAVLQSKLDDALSDAKKSELALAEALATIESLRSKPSPSVLAAVKRALSGIRSAVGGGVATVLKPMGSLKRAVSARTSPQSKLTTSAAVAAAAGVVKPTKLDSAGWAQRYKPKVAANPKVRNARDWAQKYLAKPKEAAKPTVPEWKEKLVK